MKKCPICQAGVFDDAKICFGCLHRFPESDEEVSCGEKSLSVYGQIEALKEEDIEEGICPLKQQIAQQDSSLIKDADYSSQGEIVIRLKVSAEGVSVSEGQPCKSRINESQNHAIREMNKEVIAPDLAGAKG